MIGWMRVVGGVKSLDGLGGSIHFGRKVLRHQSLGKLTVAFLAFAVLGVGCTKAAMYDTRFTPTDLALKDAITVIQVQSGEQEYSDKLEKKVVGYIKDALEDSHPTVRVVPPEEFRQVAFPDLTPEEIPRGDWTWEQLLEDPAFRERIAPLGLHYLIAVSGGTTQVLKLRLEGSIAGGALAYIGDRHSRLGATVIDLIQGSNAGHLEVDAKNTTTVGWMILPFPFYSSAPTETRACSELGEAVTTFLAGEKPPEEMKAEQFEEKIPEEWKKTKGEDQQRQFIGHGYGPNPLE
jgi:hypothetical protein